MHAATPTTWPLLPGDPLPAPANNAIDLAQFLGHWLAIVVLPPGLCPAWPGIAADHVLAVLTVGDVAMPDGWPSATHWHDPTGATAQRWGAGAAGGPQQALLLTLDPAGRVASWRSLT